MNTKEKREMIFSLLDAFTEKLAAQEEVRDSVWDWTVTISEMTFRLEEGLRHNIPVPRKAIAIGPVQEVQDVPGNQGKALQ